MNIKNVLRGIGFILWLGFGALGHAEESITVEYQKLENSYNKNIKNRNYDEAILNSKKMLEIDPADDIAYLRLAIAVYSKGSSSGKEYADYSNYASESSAKNKKLKLLAAALIEGAARK